MIRVAAYCRVSTDQADQANSFVSQKRYFREYIQSHPDWTLHEIYADEGITGTTTRKRIQFNRMMGDAYAGKFQMIVTKEVSRFSRNILDTIAYTRELKRMGIGVIFVTDRINTLEPEAEMLLSYLASMAQEESRRTSARVVWGQTRQMEQGVVFGRSLLGYDVRDGILTVEPEGAEIVRAIFHKYAAEQRGTSEIARWLTKEGYQTSRGSSQWTVSAIVKILRNEKYVGDLVQKKTYTPDFLTHAKRVNRGEVPVVRIENHHEPIVSREIWNMAQERLQKNSRHGGGGHSNRYVFSGRIRCGECGGTFVGRCKYGKDGTKIRRWSCAAAARGGTAACNVGKLLRDDDAMQMLQTAIRSLPMDPSSIISHVTALALDAVRDGETAGCDDLRRLQREIEALRRRREAAMDACFAGEITREDMGRMLQNYDRQLEALQNRRVDAQRHLQKNGDAHSAVRAEVTGILQGEIISEAFCKAVLDHITVFKDRHMELRLKGLPHIFRFIG